jgi:DNA-binding NtrC family response regulator
MSEKEKTMDDKVYKILIVDDDKDALDLLHLTLKRAEQFKSKIAIAEDGEVALAEREKQEFDIVLADYKMPRMNGIELLTLVRDKYPETLRILITGFSDINIAKEAINKAAVHNYIEKDFGNEEIRRTLYEALKRNMSFREKQELSPIEQLFESKDGRNLMYTHLTFEDAENSVHTIAEKVEDGLPEIDVIKDKLRLLAKHNLIKQVKAPPLLFKCPVCSIQKHSDCTGCLWGI